MERCHGERAGCRQIARCSACEEAKPPGVKPVSASHEHKEPWRVVGCDLAEWGHPVFKTRKVHLWNCVDEATKFTVGHVWAEGQQNGNIDGSRVMELLRERWISVFGRMHTLRTDPEGAWRNNEVHERLSDMQLVLDLHPGEASWQASVIANTIGIVKDTMTRIALERPDQKPTDVLAAGVLHIRRCSAVGVSLRHSGHLDVRRTGINHSSTTKRQIRAFGNICKGWKQPETRG